MLDTFIPVRGHVVTRVIDVATGRTLRISQGSNSISYVAPLIVMDLLVQSNFDAGSLSVGAAHPADVNRGFATTQATLTNPQHNALRYMQVGTDGTPSQRSDDALIAPVEGAAGIATVTSLHFPSNTSMRIVANFGGLKANGNTLNEVALRTRGGALSEDPEGTVGSRVFARHVTTPTPKDASIQLEYTWTISFA